MISQRQVQCVLSFDLDRVDSGASSTRCQSDVCKSTPTGYPWFRYSLPNAHVEYAKSVFNLPLLTLTQFLQHHIEVLKINLGQEDIKASEQCVRKAVKGNRARTMREKTLHVAVTRAPGTREG